LVQTYQNGKNTKLPQTMPNGHKILEMAVGKILQKYTIIVHSKAVQNMTKFGFLATLALHTSVHQTKAVAPRYTLLPPEIKPK
jgi:hypothetical protein